MEEWSEGEKRVQEYRVGGDRPSLGVMYSGRARRRVAVSVRVAAVAAAGRTGGEERRGREMRRAS